MAGMRRMNRRFSLDSLDPSMAFPENGVLGRSKSIRPRRVSEAVKTRSLEEAQQQMLELDSGINHRPLSRQDTIEEERVDPSDGGIARQSFKSHNKTFHKLFPDIPEDEDLTHAFTCALQKEVLYHGKLFISSQHIAFFSSVLLKATKVIIEVSDVQAVRKKNTAKVVPNALLIITNNEEKYMFVSLRNRDVCFKHLLSVCPQIQVDNGINSPQTSPSSFDPEMESISTHSSQEGSESQRNSMDEGHPLELTSTYADLSKLGPLESQRTSSSQRSSLSKVDPSTEEEGKGFLSVGRLKMTAMLERVKPFFEGDSNNITTLLLIYVLLLVLLLLTSGYIGLRIVALEEQLKAINSLQEECQEKAFRS